MEELFIKLKNVLLNFKKAPNRRYSATHLTRVSKLSKILYNKILANLVNYSVSEQTIYKESASKIFTEISEILDTKLGVPSKTLPSFKILCKVICIFLKSYNRIKMTSIAETIKIVAALVPQYSGSVDKLPAVISALTALKSLITNDNRAAAIQVVLSRFDGKARAAVGDNPATIDAIIDILKDKCDKRPHPETVVAKLNAAKQTGDISQFAQQIETLTTELEKCYLAENVPVNTATNLATRAGVKALTAGIRSSETKMILKAGQFNTLSAAVEKAIENEPTKEPQSISQMMYAKRGSFQSRGRANTRQNHNRGFNRKIMPKTITTRAETISIGSKIIFTVGSKTRFTLEETREEEEDTSVIRLTMHIHSTLQKMLKKGNN